MVSTLKGKRDRALLGLLVGCGLRREELVQLTQTALADKTLVNDDLGLAVDSTWGHSHRAGFVIEHEAGRKTANSLMFTCLAQNAKSVNFRKP